MQSFQINFALVLISSHCGSYFCLIYLTVQVVLAVMLLRVGYCHYEMHTRTENGAHSYVTCLRLRSICERTICSMCYMLMFLKRQATNTIKSRPRKNKMLKRSPLYPSTNIAYSSSIIFRVDAQNYSVKTKPNRGRTHSYNIKNNLTYTYCHGYVEKL